jgi:hypothetical protein
LDGLKKQPVRLRQSSTTHPYYPSART